MSTSLSRLLVRLGERPYDRLAFARGEPHFAVSLSSAARAALKSGRREAIYAAAGVVGDLAPPKIIVFPRSLT